MTDRRREVSVIRSWTVEKDAVQTRCTLRVFQTDTWWLESPECSRGRDDKTPSSTWQTTAQTNCRRTAGPTEITHTQTALWSHLYSLRTNQGFTSSTTQNTSYQRRTFLQIWAKSEKHAKILKEKKNKWQMKNIKFKSWSTCNVRTVDISVHIIVHTIVHFQSR